MKILWLTTSTNNTDTVIRSLDNLKLGDITLFRYDAKFHQEAQQAMQQNPQVQDLMRSGQWPPPEMREAWRRRCAMDAEILSTAREMKPDLIIYTSAWEGVFVPDNESLGELNTIAPLVHLLFDGADPPWWPQLEEFERRGVFALTVNIDGSPDWPGGPHWTKRLKTLNSFQVKNALTLLTPIDMTAFEHPVPAFPERPYAVGYAGNSGGPVRSHLVQRLARDCKNFVHKPRDDHPASYKLFGMFLQNCRVSINVGFTGSNAAKHVKGRVLETGFAGTCLMEWTNPATRHWFTPRYEFFEYASVEEAVDLADYLSTHPRLCEEAATALRERVMKEHHPSVFWKRVTQRALGGAE